MTTSWIDSLRERGEHETRLREDLAYFAEHALKIRPKIGSIQPLIFNAAQRKLHGVIERQRADALIYSLLLSDLS